MVVLCVVFLYDLGYGLFFYVFEKVFGMDYELYM